LISVYWLLVGSNSGGGARLVFDPDEVVQDRLAGQPFDDPETCLTACQACGHHGHAERLQRAGHVDPFAAGEREPRARAVALPALKVRDGDRARERGVERDGDDHWRARIKL